MKLLKIFQDNPSFKKWISDMVFHLTYNPEGKPYEMPEVRDDKQIILFEHPERQRFKVAEDIKSFSAKDKSLIIEKEVENYD